MSRQEQTHEWMDSDELSRKQTGQDHSLGLARREGRSGAIHSLLLGLLISRNLTSLLFYPLCCTEWVYPGQRVLGMSPRGSDSGP